MPEAPGPYRWSFLAKPAEQPRYQKVTELIQSVAGRGALIELGAGEGRLLSWLDPAQITEYIAVDPDAAALSRIVDQGIPVRPVVAPVENFTPDAGPIAVLVATEVLYFVEEPARHLLRIWRAAGAIDVAIVTLVRPRPDKPNWRRAAARVEAAIAATGWPIAERVVVGNADGDLAWEVVAMRPGSVPGDQSFEA